MVKYKIVTFKLPVRFRLFTLYIIVVILQFVIVLAQIWIQIVIQIYYNFLFYYLFFRSNLNQFQSEKIRVNRDIRKIKVTNFVGICINTTKLNNSEVLLTAVLNGHMDGDTLFKFEIFSFVRFLTIYLIPILV